MADQNPASQYSENADNDQEWESSEGSEYEAESGKSGKTWIFATIGVLLLGIVVFLIVWFTCCNSNDGMPVEVVLDGDSINNMYKNKDKKDENDTDLKGDFENFEEESKKVFKAIFGEDPSDWSFKRGSAKFECKQSFSDEKKKEFDVLSEPEKEKDKENKEERKEFTEAHRGFARDLCNKLKEQPALKDKKDVTCIVKFHVYNELKEVSLGTKIEEQPKFEPKMDVTKALKLKESIESTIKEAKLNEERQASIDKLKTEEVEKLLKKVADKKTLTKEDAKKLQTYKTAVENELAKKESKQEPKEEPEKDPKEEEARIWKIKDGENDAEIDIDLTKKYLQKDIEELVTKKTDRKYTVDAKKAEITLDPKQEKKKTTNADLEDPYLTFDRKEDTLRYLLEKYTTQLKEEDQCVKPEERLVKERLAEILKDLKELKNDLNHQLEDNNQKTRLDRNIEQLKVFLTSKDPVPGLHKLDINSKCKAGLVSMATEFKQDVEKLKNGAFITLTISGNEFKVRDEALGAPGAQPELTKQGVVSAVLAFGTQIGQGRIYDWFGRSFKLVNEKDGSFFHPETPITEDIHLRVDQKLNGQECRIDDTRNYPQFNFKEHKTDVFIGRHSDVAELNRNFIALLAENQMCRYPRNLYKQIHELEDYATDFGKFEWTRLTRAADPPNNIAAGEFREREMLVECTPDGTLKFRGCETDGEHMLGLTRKVTEKISHSNLRKKMFQEFKKKFQHNLVDCNLDLSTFEAGSMMHSMASQPESFNTNVAAFYLQGLERQMVNHGQATAAKKVVNNNPNNNVICTGNGCIPATLFGNQNAVYGSQANGWLHGVPNHDNRIARYGGGQNLPNTPNTKRCIITDDAFTELKKVMSFVDNIDDNLLVGQAHANALRAQKVQKCEQKKTLVSYADCMASAAIFDEENKKRDKKPQTKMLYNYVYDQSISAFMNLLRGENQDYVNGTGRSTIFAHDFKVLKVEDTQRQGINTFGINIMKDTNKLTKDGEKQFNEVDEHAFHGYLKNVIKQHLAGVSHEDLEQDTKNLVHAFEEGNKSEPAPQEE